MTLIKIGMRNGLRTLRKRENGLAQNMRTGAIRILCLCFLLGIQPRGWAAKRTPLWEFTLSQDRVFVLDPESQQWQMGRLGLRLSEWRTLPKPTGMFQALRLLPGPAGGVYVQDALEPRLCFFDTAGQLVSCRRLPEAYGNRRSSRIVVVPRRDGRFVFLDQDLGEATVWKEARPDDANSQWQKTVSVRISRGFQSCLEAPWYSAMCCEGPGKFQCYDPYLNALPSRPESSWFATPRHVLRRDTKGDLLGFSASVGSDTIPSICFDFENGLGPCLK